MDCTITYNGKAYTEQEFKRLVEASFSNYKATQSSQNAVEAYNIVMKQADAVLGFLDQYSITLDDDKSFEPKELQEGDRKDITKALMKIDGLANNHFNYFTNFIANIAAKSFNINAKSITNENKLKSEIQAELTNMLDAYEATLDNIAEKLNALSKPDDKVVQLNIKKIQVAKDKLKIVKDNFDTIANVGLQKLYKDANIKVTTKTNEDGTTTTTVDEVDDNAKIADMEEESSEDSVTDFEEVNSERDENYSQTSLEKNPKNSVRKELRILMRGIPVTDKDGNPMNTVMGIPAFVDFDTIFDTVIGLMADKSFTIDEAIAHLRDNSDARPWLNEFANRLESSSDQVKNQFLHTMGNHALTMNFVQYSFDKDGRFTAKVMNTNSAELRRKTLSNWRNNLLGTDLLEADPETGQYFVNKNEALRLLEEYESWFKGKAISNLRGVSGLTNLQKEVIRIGKDLEVTDKGTIKRLGLKSEDFEEGEIKIYTVNNKIGDKYDTKELRVKKVNGNLKYILGKPTTSPISRALTVKSITVDGKDMNIMEYQNMEPEEQAEAIDKVLEWLEAFGIDMHPNAIHRIFSGQYYVDKNTKLTPDKFFASTDKAHQPIGILASWLNKAVNAENTIISPELEGNHPFRDNSIENGLARFQAKYVENVATSSFRSGKKSIYGYTAYKYITDRFIDLKTNNDDILTKLKSLAFSKNSAWLQWLENSALPNAFNISHLDLNALKESGKKIYKDNGITILADADHEVVKLGLHTDMKQGSTKVMFSVGGINFPMRIASMLFPTMSDKTTEVVVKAPVFKLNNIDYYTFNEETKTLEPNDEILRLVFDQLVLPEIERIADSNGKTTNIKGYDAGKQLLMFLPGLNDLKVSYTLNDNSIWEGTLKNLLSSDTFKVENNLNDELKLQIYPKIKEYLNELVKNKMKVWEENELVTKGEDGETTLKFFDAAYVKDTDEKSKLTNDLKANVIAFDFVINQMISNANVFMTIIGDPALYYKADPNTSNVKQVKDTFTNVGKRLAAMIAPGSKLAGSKNETYQQIFLGDRISLSQNIGYLTEILDDKKFDAEEYNRIMAIENKDEKQIEYDKFMEQYPNSAGYFDIESTDAQEYTTWQEHLHVLKQMGKTSDKVLSLTNEDLKEAEKIFTENIPFEEMTEEQQEIFRKVLQPLKPVYTGQIFDEAQGVMRMMYIKSSSFPLVPQLTAGLELDKLRLALQEFQKDGFVRASYQTANKVGALTAPLKMFDNAGKIKPITQQQLQEASLVLNRKDFKIQQDVPFKSAKRSEDTTTMGSQLTKVLFGNGMMELSGFMMDGTPYSGKKLQQIYNETFTELYNLKKQKLYNELGIDEKTNQPINIKETALKLQELLKNEAIDRGWSKQEIDGLELEFIYDRNGKIVDYKFKLPLWMSANSNRIEALFNAIVDNRLVKTKLPGNAYVAGSEEGFKIQSNFKGIDKSQIVWLNNEFNGELQAANEKDGEFKPAQILVASKFRDNDGNLIDLLEKDGDNYKYIIETDKGFQLNEEMFDKELLDMITFRIPTSGHMSGSKVTVAGFLPHQVGDLIITPKNFTKQMGQDFDVDKLSSYQLWHTQDENGKLRPIKTGDKVKNIKEKLLQNKLINIHLAVFGNKNKEVQKKINAILSTDYAEDQAKRIEEVNAQDDTFFTPMSDEYQKQKMALGASGKIGTGAYSLDVTSHSLFEQAKSNGNQLQLLDNDKPFKMSFGSIDTEGKLGESKTKVVSKKDYFIARMNSLEGNDVILDNLIELLKKDEEVGLTLFEGQTQNYPELKRILDDYNKLQRTIAEVLSERQNIAVDNEKLQVMGKVNLNSYTMDVDKVLCMLGFDKGEDGNSISFLFLSQPIIKDYVAEMSKATSNIKGFNKDAEADVIQKLYEKYASPETLKLLEESENSYEFDTAFGNQLTTDEMYNELTKNSTGGKVNNHLQVIALNRFLMLKGYGLSLRNVQGAINTDSKGLGKSIPEIGERIKTITALVNNDKIQNADKLIGDYLLTEGLSLKELEAKEKEGYIHVTENLMIKPTTSIGAVSLNALLTANTLWEKHFPYNKVSINTAIDEVMQLVSKSEASEAKKAEKQHMILKEIKKYLNAVMTQKNLIKSGTATEERYRLMYDDKKSNKVSLARYLSVVASKFPQLQQNKLIQRFNYDIDYTGKPSMILYENTAGANFDEDGLNNALLELLSTDLTLPEFNGEIYSAKKLAQDLINYAMLEGGVQEATQFAKFIPISYLEKMGFTNALNSINYDTTNLFGFRENGPSDFAIQFARNNPTSLPKLLMDSELASKKLNNSISISDAGYNSQNAPNFIAFREKGKDYIWMKLGKEYKPVSVSVSKGNAGQKVFAYDIDPNQKQKQISKGKVREVAPPIPNEPVNDSAVSNVINSERFELGNDSFVNILNNVVNTSGLPDNITVILKQLISKVNPNTKIEVVSGINSNGTYKKGVIEISKEYAETATNEDLARTILKETVHSVTDELILKHTDVNGNLEPKDGVPGAQAARNLIALFKRADAALSSGKYAEKYKSMREKFEKLKAGKDVGFDKEEKRILYGTANIKEFIEMMLTQPEFQQAMSEIKIGSSNTTLMDKFRAFIKSVLEAIGVEPGTLTDEAIKNIFQLIEESKPQVQTQPSTSVKPNGTINVYWGQVESATSTKILSNLAPRKFIYQGKEYGSVEHAYQTLKSGAFDKTTYDAYVKAGGYGTKIRGKAVTQGFDNLQLIKDLVVESFKQNSNSEAAKKLLQYENFTHNTNEIIDKAFLEGLKLAQQTLLSTQSSTSVKEGVVELFENNPTLANSVEVADGIKIIKNSITFAEELELFNELKPYLEAQGSQTNKGTSAPIMIGLGLRWDYTSNNPGKTPVELGETINNSQSQKNKYRYYNVAHNGQPLGAVSQRLKSLVTKATGFDATNYDGAIINIYPKNGFISAHNDVDESATAINYPVLVLNIGGDGSLSVEGAESQKAKKGYAQKEYTNTELQSGDAYVFGEDGLNRDVFHRTLPSSGKGTLPALNVQGKIIPANSYRITITLRRVQPLTQGMPTAPAKLNNQPTTTQEVYNKVKTNLSQLVNRENAEFNVNPDSITFPDDINLSEFNGYPKTLTFVSEENITDAQLKFISTHKEYIEAMLNETGATDMNELLEAIGEKEVDPTASQIEVGMSDSTIADIANELAETENMISESTSGEKIELFPGVFANAGQTKAIEKLNNFVKDKGKQVFVLKGRGGTGKTTIIKKILDGIKGEIAAATISHKAKGVLQNSMGPSVQVGTIAAALGLKPKRNNPGVFEKNPKFNKSNSPFYNADVIIIDECSMLTQEMVNDIINFSKNPNVKIIFMGDNVQLPPIETDVKLQNKDSTSFSANTKPEYTATLTERMRQGEDSPIVVLSDVIAANVENKEPELRVIKNRKNKFDEKKNTGILFETKDSMMGQLTNDLQNDKENTKIIAYTNAEKDSMNNLAREILWGKGNTNEFNKGEILINEDTKEESSIASQNVFNGEQYVVLDSTPININVKKLNGDFSINTMTLPGYSLKVQNENGETITMQILSPKIKSKYAEVQKNNASLAFKMGGISSWDTYWNNEEEHVKVDYGYAITSHKSQGSTYNNVYVMEDNILGVQDASIKTKNESLYVAVTRPRYKAVIVSNKNASNVAVGEEYKTIGLNINTRGKSFDPKEENWTSQTNECGI